VRSSTTGVVGCGLRGINVGGRNSVAMTAWSPSSGAGADIDAMVQETYRPND